MTFKTESPTDKNSLDQKLESLTQHALRAGASGAKILSTNEITLNEKFAALCRESKCGNYGRSKSCPPYVAGPSGFQEQLDALNYALFFKIDVPSAMLSSSDALLSAEARAVFQLLHEVAAGIESQARAMGFEDSQAYAGGSCKQIFCYQNDECLALSENGRCRHPELARPSMSGFGIDVGKLFETCGWEMRWVFAGGDATETFMASVCGLVLIG